MPSTSSPTQSGRPSLLEESEAPVCRLSTPDIVEPSSRRRSIPDVGEPSQPPQKRTPSPDPESYSSVSTNIYSDVFSFKGTKEVFDISYTFIRALLTSSEVRYQLSTTLEQDTRELRIRRLAPSETRRLTTDRSTPLRFKEDRTLYTLHKDPSNSAVRVMGLESETCIDCISKR